MQTHSVEIKAKTLEEALIQASISLNCSIVNLKYEIIQMPSKGFLNIGKKEAIILASIKEESQEEPMHAKELNLSSSSQEIPQEKLAPNLNPNQEIQEKELASSFMAQTPIQKPHILNENTPKAEQAPFNPPIKDDSTLNTLESKTMPQKSPRLDKFDEIEEELKELFSHLPYKISKVEVSLYEPSVLLIDIDGEDSALLIGEKGYRYKALSYLLFNWIHPKYGYNIRLEISTFLKNQEKVMDTYLESVIMSVHEVGKAQVKALDGVLTYIALKKLRKTFPNKYISLKTNLNDEQYIVINDFFE
ncbi:Jag N-terminal domain-containing protein [Helicobacter cetorum]|uniref:Jag N-terminal domain-containing protein n=1 Tax=Helicobacter cetorum TaxID=138563 RepID=UPI000CF0EC54|nr:Jag N-terminal domain-containing protein [Helicobacter cetorum]